MDNLESLRQNRKSMMQSFKVDEATWETTCSRYVGFIDIMGFKDMVVRNTHETIYNKLITISQYKDLVQNTVHFSFHPPKVFIFSDSIILFTIDDSSDAICDLLLKMGNFIAALIENEIPFRGGIAYGQITVDDKNSIFFGQPLIDAYLLSEELALYAVAIHHTAENRILKDEDANDFIFKYNTPVKIGKVFHYLVSACVYSLYMRQAVVSDLMEKFRSMTSGALRKYIDNTEEFLETILTLQKEIEEKERIEESKQGSI
jgi:hypothetical protein